MRKGAVVLCALSLLAAGVLASPCAAQKGSKGPTSYWLTSNTYLKNTPIRMLMVDDTNEGTTPGFAVFFPHRMTLRGLGKVNTVEMADGGQQKEGATVLQAVMLPADDAEMLLLRLYDVRRIGREWRDNPGGEKSVDFNPHPYIQLRLKRLSDTSLLFAFTLKDHDYYGPLTDVTLMIEQLERSLTWLKKKR